MSRLPDVDLSALQSGHLPLYIELQERLRKFVVAGSGRVMLPPERALAAAYGVSRVTVRKALDGLKQEGLISAHQGHGTITGGRGEGALPP